MNIQVLGLYLSVMKFEIGLWRRKKVRKVNICFILECIIIVLMLTILGLLLKDNNGDRAEKVLWDETAAESEMIEETGSEKVVVHGTVKEPEMISVSENNFSEGITLSSNDITVSANSVSENQMVPVSYDKFLEGKNIVVFGDSIWDDARGQDGISEYIQERTGATVYNCAVGGSSAALVGEDAPANEWTSESFNGMVYIVRNLVSADRIIASRDAYDIIKQVDMEEMDYVIVSYGLNDYFSGVSIYPQTYYEVTNYVGALRNGISKLKEHYPQLRIVMVAPTFTRLFEGEREFVVADYVEAARGVSEEMGVEFIDMFHALGSNAEARTSHLQDGVHLSAEGRELYADTVIQHLQKIEE